MKWRKTLSRLLAVSFCSASCLLPQLIQQGMHPPGSQEQLGLVIPMRDGVRLAADVFLPEATGRWPTVLFRTPYNRKGPASPGYRQFVRRGYAVVIQDVRGRNASQGTFGMPEQEGPDGYDTLNWIAAQPWSNGKVAMAGASYIGIVQWWAAVGDNPHLAAIAPMFSGDDDYLDRFYSTGGAFKLGHRLLWVAENLTPPWHVKPLFSSYIDHVPLRTSDLLAAGAEIPLWRTALAHPSYDAFWKSHSIRERWNRVNVPVLSFGGWFDNYVESDLDMFTRLSSNHQPVETWIGPWGHNATPHFSTRDFGYEGSIPIRGKEMNFFDYWMRQPAIASAAQRQPTLHLFVMGPDTWREEHEWPLARTRFTPLYLDSRGRANSNVGDGVLQWSPVATARPDSYTYDPDDPVETAGGPICCDPIILPPGPLDQTKVERRSDVLVYTSPVLNENVEVTGPVRAVLYVSTSANDTDFTAKLVDVSPDGDPLAVCDGIQRLRYRLSLSKPVFVKRNAKYQITVDAGVTSYVFSRRHRIRLEISSSNFPRFDRNLNTSAPNAGVSKAVIAHQTVYHEKVYPSALILPVIPRGSGQ